MARVKKNADPREGARGDSFLEWGGEAQQRYESWRQLALAGRDVGWFRQRGMAVFAPGADRLWVVRRRRASVRAGELDLVGLLLELGILGRRAESPERRQAKVS